MEKILFVTIVSFILSIPGVHSQGTWFRTQNIDWPPSQIEDSSTVGPWEIVITPNGTILSFVQINQHHTTLLLAMDSTGEIIWNRLVGRHGLDYVDSYSLHPTVDNGCVFFTKYNSSGNYMDSVSRLDANGQVIWRRPYINTPNDVVYNVTQSIYNTTLVQFTDSLVEFDPNGWMLRYRAPFSRTAKLIHLTDVSFIDMQDGYSCGGSTLDAVVMKTADGGQTWNNVLTAVSPFSSSISMAKLDVINKDVLFSSLMYSNILYRSVDGGTTWDSINISQIYAITDFDFVSANEGRILSTMGEIFNTVDGGQTWTLEYAVASGAYGPFIFLNSISFSGSTGYVGASDGLVKKFSNSPNAINKPQATGSISIYPNPISISNSLMISGISGDYNLEIFNSLGETMLQENNNVVRGKPVVLNNLKLSTGVYTISIRSNHDKVTSKIVVVE